jgi:hypothetical protein
MTDLHSLLTNAAHPDLPTPSPDQVEADVARGHRALVHRTMRRTGTRSVLVGALALGTFAVVHPEGSHRGAQPTAIAPATRTTTVAPVIRTTTVAPVIRTTTVAPTKPKTTVQPAIRLVAYTGAQPAGYTVNQVPAGWEIQGVNNFALAIAPTGFADQDLNDFVGKLVVMLISKDEKPPTDGVPVDVGVPGTGRISHDNPGEPILTFKDESGHWLDIQVPASLHWTDAQVAAFGNHVHANATAEAGAG